MVIIIESVGCIFGRTTIVGMSVHLIWHWLPFCLSTGADSNLRDYSGKKPYQYSPRQDTSVSTDTFRSEYQRSKSSFERVGIYSSLRNSLFKFNPSSNSDFYVDVKPSLPEPQSSSSSSPSSTTTSSAPAAAFNFGGPEQQLSKADPKRATRSTSFLRELRPSVRKRPISVAALNSS